MPIKYEDEICPMCQERVLFNEVKEYIREHNVTEHDVSKHFNLPLSKVRGWIRDGRIQYRDGEQPMITGLHCLHCGKPILSGEYCVKCQRLLGGVKGISGEKNIHEDSRMRYMDGEKKKGQ